MQGHTRAAPRTAIEGTCTQTSRGHTAEIDITACIVVVALPQQDMQSTSMRKQGRGGVDKQNGIAGQTMAQRDHTQLHERNQRRSAIAHTKENNSWARKQRWHGVEGMGMPTNAWKDGGQGTRDGDNGRHLHKFDKADLVTELRLSRAFNAVRKSVEEWAVSNLLQLRLWHFLHRVSTPQL